MAETKIEWTDFTFNPWRGCSKVSPGCAHCYAEKMSHRNPAVLGEWGPNGKRAMAAESYWQQPLAWNRKAAKEGVRRRVFCASLADVFEDRPELNDSRLRLFALIAATRHLDWQLLTKRPHLAAVMMETVESRRPWPGWPLPNLWLGTSVENQAAADERIPHLLKCPAAVRFLSCEPLLGPVDLEGIRDASRFPGCARFDVLRGRMIHEDDGDQWTKEFSRIDWIICGGESGPNARPMHPAWARSLRDQCAVASVPYFFKQWGQWGEVGPPSADQCLVCECGWSGPFAEAQAHNSVCTARIGSGCAPMQVMYNVGKHSAGRLLDGVQHDAFPEVRG